MQTIAMTISAIAMSFAGNGDKAEIAPLDQILINRPEHDSITNLHLQFSPINMGEIKKIENQVVALGGTTQCCASGTCDNIDLGHYDHDYMMWWCMQPDGPPCP